MMSGEELQTQDGAQTRHDYHAYHRLILLSDAVFGIAITLAALEIRVPEDWHDLAGLWAAMEHPIRIYFVSFAIVASYWGSQRSLFSRLVRVDEVLTALALLQLMFVALVPVATGLFYEHRELAGSLSIYLATLAICGYLNAAMWAYTALRPALVHVESRAKHGWPQCLKTVAAPVLLTCLALAMT
jgi:uncharacterized membrane protein